MKICYLADAQNIHTKKWTEFFVKRGNQVHVISFSEAAIEGTTVHFIRSKIPQSKIKYLLNIGRVRNLIHEIHPDVLHAHHATSYGFLGACSGYRPFVITAHGSDILVSPEQSIFLRTIVKYSLRKADLITTVAEHMRRRIGQLGIDKNTIHVFQYGLDLDEFTMQKKHKSNEERFRYIISIRALKPLYNIEMVIRAFPLVLNEQPCVKLKIVGDGPLRKKLTNLTYRLGLGSKVEFKGSLSHPEVVRELYDSEVYVSTAKSDGCSLSLLEALATGTIPVVSDIPANREWIVDGENGYLVPLNDTRALADKIVQAFIHRTVKSDTIQKNRNLVEQKASLEKNLLRMERLYSRLYRENE